MAKKPFGAKYRTYDDSKGRGSGDSWQRAFAGRMGGKVAEEPPALCAPLHDAKTAEELKKAYRVLMAAHHPDKVGDTPEAKANAQLINETYNRLKKTLTPAP